MCLTLSQKPERMNELIGTVFRFLWYYRVTVFTVVVDNEGLTISIYTVYIFILCLVSPLTSLIHSFICLLNVLGLYVNSGVHILSVI